MKKILLFIILMLITTQVHAVGNSFYYDSERIEDMWVTQKKGDTVQSAHPYKLKKRSDNSYVYCIQPLTKLKKDIEYTETNNYELLGLTEEQVNRINLIAYYGYGYENHTTNTWYGVTQFMIWKEVGKGIDIYFTSSKNGAEKNLYTKEINEIESLISRHNEEPNYLKDYVITTNQELVIDSNINLDDYNIETDVKYELKDNKLVFNNLEVGDYSIKLTKKNNRFKTSFAMYYNSGSQNLFAPGYSSIYDKEYSFNIAVKEGELVLKKNGSDTNHPLKDAQYGVYQDDKLITTIKTDSQGIGKVKLPLGSYTIKELVAPPGYKIDNQKYTIKIDENNLTINITLYDDKDIIEVPDTGVKDYQKESILLIVLGSLGLWYVKKKSYVH